MNAPTESGHWQRTCARVFIIVVTSAVIGGCFTVNVGSLRNETVSSLVNARYQYVRCETALNNRRNLYDILVTDLDEGPLVDGSDSPLTGDHDGPLTGDHDSPLTGDHDGPLTGDHDAPLDGVFLRPLTIGPLTIGKGSDFRLGSRCHSGFGNSLFLVM